MTRAAELLTMTPDQLAAEQAQREAVERAKESPEGRLALIQYWLGNQPRGPVEAAVQSMLAEVVKLDLSGDPEMRKGDVSKAMGLSNWSKNTKSEQQLRSELDWHWCETVRTREGHSHKEMAKVAEDRRGLNYESLRRAHQRRKAKKA